MSNNGRKILESVLLGSGGVANQFDLSRSAQSNAYPYKSREKLSLADLPISPQKSEWEDKSDSAGNYIERMYEFSSVDHILYFLEEALRKSEEVDHHAVIVTKGLSASVTLSTDLVQDVTELDLQMAKFLDEIYEDIHFIGSQF